MKTSMNTAAVPLSLEDLLFSKKNKEYGAFVLRKSYKRNLITACAAAIFVFSAVTSSQLIFKKEIIASNDKKPDTTRVILRQPPSIEGQDETKIFEIPPSTIKTIKFTVPKIVDYDIDEKLENIPTVQDLLNVQPWTKTQDADIGGVDPTLVFLEPDPKADPETIQTIFTWVAEMPHFPGGEGALTGYISSNIVYPELARKAGIQGRVITSFTIERSGMISDIRIEKGIGGGCDEEAVRVISSMGKWQPGKQNGNPVRVRMMIPIHFKLQ